MRQFDASSFSLFWLQVGVLPCDILDARAVLLRVQVVMTNDEGLRIASAQLSEQPAHGSLLLSRFTLGPGPKTKCWGLAPASLLLLSMP